MAAPRRLAGVPVLPKYYGGPHTLTSLRPCCTAAKIGTIGAQKAYLLAIWRLINGHALSINGYFLLSWSSMHDVRRAYNVM